MSIFALPGLILTVVSLVTFVMQGFAFVHAVTQRPDAFVAAGKLTKQTWVLILGLALAAHMLFWDPINLFNIAGIIAAIVYLVDVRPALQSLLGR